VSTCGAKRIGRSPGHRIRLIILDPVAVLCSQRIGEISCRAYRCLRARPVTRALLALLFVAGSSFCVVAQIGFSQSRSEQSAKEAVKAAYEAYLRAWQDKDLNALSHLLSDDYQAVNFQGIVSVKANEIATTKEDRTYNTLRGNVVSVVVLGDCAITSGLIEASWKNEQENPQGSTFRFLVVLRKQKGDWKLVATQSTNFNKSGERGKK
jgi:uncharacterized protein (TIGR02246 family)